MPKPAAATSTSATTDATIAPTRCSRATAVTLELLVLEGVGAEALLAGGDADAGFVDAGVGLVGADREILDERVVEHQGELGRAGVVLEDERQRDIAGDVNLTPGLNRISFEVDADPSPARFGNDLRPLMILLSQMRLSPR